MFKDKRVDELLDKIIINSEIISTQNITIGEITKKYEYLINELSNIKNEYDQFRKDINNRFKNVSSLIEEKIDIQKESNESLIIGLEKHISHRIDNISSSKTIVTDLLKKIAVLEGLKDSIEHRRSTKELLEKLKNINEQMLRDQREDKDISIKELQISLLRWALGEIDE